MQSAAGPDQRSVARADLRNIVYSRKHLTACVGVSDLIVVQAEGVTLVCAKDRAQDIKLLVKGLHERGDCQQFL